MVEWHLGIAVATNGSRSSLRPLGLRYERGLRSHNRGSEGIHMYAPETRMIRTILYSDTKVDPSSVLCRNMHRIGNIHLAWGDNFLFGGSSICSLCLGLHLLHSCLAFDSLRALLQNLLSSFLLLPLALPVLATLQRCVSADCNQQQSGDGADPPSHVFCGTVPSSDISCLDHISQCAL